MNGVLSFRMIKVAGQELSTDVAERKLATLTTKLDREAVHMLAAAIAVSADHIQAIKHAAIEMGDKQDLIELLDILTSAYHQLTGHDVEYFMRMLTICNHYVRMVLTNWLME